MWLWKLLWLAAIEAIEAKVIPLDEVTELRVCSANILRLTRWPSKEAAKKGRISLVAREEGTWPVSHYEVIHLAQEIRVTTSELSLSFEKASASVSFRASNRLILEEVAHKLSPTTDMGKPSFKAEQSWRAAAGEALYGGGSYQNGLVNYKNAPVSMIQFNLEAVVPFFVSSEGYGLLWDNYAWTYLNPPDAEKPLVKPVEGKGQTGEVLFQAHLSGDFFFHVGRLMDDTQEPSFGAGRETIVVAESEQGEDLVIINWTNQQNHPSSITGRLPSVQAGSTYKIRFSFDIPGAGLYVQGPGKVTTLRSALAEAIDYYFVLGDVDTIISGYRQITGTAPLYGKFAYGFWQSREHYATQTELLAAAREFRNRKIPIDAIVQDWHYWGNLGWGPEWDPEIYPDPAAMVRELTGMKLKLLVSVWGKADNKTALYKAMKPRGMVLGNTNQTSGNWYDAWNPDARNLYYSFCNQSHFSIGVESLWLDATEPEGLVNENQETYIGSGNLLMNTYSLQTTTGIADGLRRDYPTTMGARVFSLTRSSFAGQQRTGAALWTGDTAGTWDMLRRQVASSINYQLSGIPYWSQDIGGFFRPSDQYNSTDYQKLLIRWFQFGVFTPIFRVHGAGTHTEIWNFGKETMHTINTSAILLRYRLMPYIYSGFWQVESQHYTMQRGLVFDFPDDEAVRNLADEFMFGPSLLITPIVSPEHGAVSRTVYFPQGSWIHFHTGTSHQGTQKVYFDLDAAPFFVRSGSILVLGPSQQFATEKSSELEVRIYKGGDASWTLFEDDGHSQQYRLDAFSTIQFSWKEQQQALIISHRLGSFPGMASEKRICVVFVSVRHGVGVQQACDQEVVYRGQRLVVSELTITV